jgi:hypothetical protein
MEVSGGGEKENAPIQPADRVNAITMGEASVARADSFIRLERGCGFCAG